VTDSARARRWFIRVSQSISHLAGRGRPSGWAAAYNTNGADHAHKFAALANRLRPAHSGCAGSTSNSGRRSR
jgi:hypothetical protein